MSVAFGEYYLRAETRKVYGGRDMQQALQIQRIIHKFSLQDLNLSDQLRLGVKVKVKCTLVQAVWSIGGVEV
jgi:hypothetical protein